MFFNKITPPDKRLSDSINLKQPRDVNMSWFEKMSGLTLTQKTSSNKIKIKLISIMSLVIVI